MNEYRWADLRVGLSHEFQVTLTPEMPAAVWTVRAPARTEQAFDYFY